MDHLKEQLKNHYDKTQPSEEFLQKLLTLEAPQTTPPPVRVNPWRKYLSPIAAVLIVAVSILGGGKYLMDMVPPTEIAPGSAANEMIPRESAVDSHDVEPSDTPDDPVPEGTAPEPDAADMSAPQPSAPSAPTGPTPSDDTPDPTPPVTDAGSADDPTPPPEDDVLPHDPGEDEPTTEPGVDAPTEPSDDPVLPPDEPVVPPIEIPDIPYPPEYKPGDDQVPARPSGEPGDPIDPPDDSADPSAKPLVPPEITGHYAYENEQHMVYLTNSATGESITLNLTSQITSSGYHGIHSLFGYLVYVSLYSPPTSESIDPSGSTSPSHFTLDVTVIDKV